MGNEISILVVGLLYGVPSFLLYVLILFQLIRPKYRSRFNNPFFRLCFVIGVVDCLGYLIFYFFTKLPQFSIASSIYSSPFFDSLVLTTSMHFSVFAVMYYQMFINCFLTLNRFTAIVFPIRHKKLSRVLFPVSIVATVVASIAPCWHIPTIGSSYVPLQADSPDEGLLYGIPSFLLYVLILFQLIRPKYRSRFNNPFFRLCFVIGVVDCLGYLIFYFFFKLPMFSIASSIYGSPFFDSLAFTTSIHFSLFIFMYYQIFINCFLTLNRFTAIVFPIRHKKLSRVLFPVSIVATVVASIAPCWQILTIGSSYIPLQAETPDEGYRLVLKIRCYSSLYRSSRSTMDNLPYDFLDQVSSVLSEEQLRMVRSLDAPKWTQVAHSHELRRRYFDVNINIFYAPNGTLFDDGRIAVQFEEVTVDSVHGPLLNCDNLDVLKSLDQRLIRFHKLDFHYTQFCGEPFCTNITEIVDYVTQRLHSGSSLTVESPSREDVDTNPLVLLVNTEKILNFKKFELRRDCGELCQQILLFQMGNNPQLNELFLVGSEKWNGEAEKEAVKQFINKRGPKALGLKHDSALESVEVYLKKWLLDPTFEMELAFVESEQDLSYFGRYMHRLAENWYGRSHPENENSCVLAQLDDFPLKLSIRFCADSGSLPDSWKEMLPAECVDKDMAVMRSIRICQVQDDPFKVTDAEGFIYQLNTTTDETVFYVCSMEGCRALVRAPKLSTDGDGLLFVEHNHEMEKPDNDTPLNSLSPQLDEDFDIVSIHDVVRPAYDFIPLDISVPKKSTPFSMVCPLECTEEVRQWFCGKCDGPLVYDYQHFFYCHCGAFPRDMASFKCSHENHKEEFVEATKDDLEKVFDEYGSCEEINILLLGETGAGKSTWVNSIFNYVKFSSLDEAIRSGDPEIPIHSVLNAKIKGCSVRIEIGEADDNESQIVGESATQKPKTYTFLYEHRLIRFIDVPGVGDCRGVTQDRKNFSMIMNALDAYRTLHGIAILIPAGTSRLTVAMRYCINTLLTQLHQDAAKNIIFCFTKSRSYDYDAGDTEPILQKHLTEFEIEKNVNISLTEETMYSFDNEGFNYLCFALNGHFLPRKEVFAESWEISLENSYRALNHFLAIEPHSTRDMLSINEAKRIILGLTPISVEITKNIQLNKRIIRAMKMSLMQTKKKSVDLSKMLNYQQTVVECVPLNKPRTVCASHSCTGKIPIPGTKETMVVYKTVCHDGCGVRGSTLDKYPNPRLQYCRALKSDISKCVNCGCSWNCHLHISYEHVQRTKNMINRSVQNVLNKNDDKRVQLQDVITGLEERFAVLNSQELKVKSIAAKFMAFLQSNAIAVTNDAYGEYLKMCIDQAKQEVAATGEGQQKVEELEKYLREYEQEVAIFSARVKGNEKITVEDVEDMKNELKNMSELGPQFCSFMNALEKVDEQEKEDPEEVHLSWFGTEMKYYKNGMRERVWAGINKIQNMF
ncbi:hypothetical protein QR680_007384 [Steinernema hermaphroditum]|uniref:Serpentine receptor class gamma n=1 Tax=Steinernema hermaphroditum TaxID=289476 RepID=A0AA39M5A9_9BILA|nr:hypothetical protein QR680_007384 [Steinernema hermaphroditum]